jgi:GrpB-like predicted nucleotidyltransferase (UPF0157 family)
MAAPSARSRHSSSSGRCCCERTKSSNSRRSDTMIIIAPYNPDWPVMFAAEAVRIRQALGDRALRIEHVGSTSVPGLAAKPVVDIQVSVPSLEPADRYCTWLADLGYRRFRLGAFDLVYPFFQEAGRMAEHPPCSSLRRRVRTRARPSRLPGLPSPQSDSRSRVRHAQAPAFCRARRPHHGVSGALLAFQDRVRSLRPRARVSRGPKVSAPPPSTTVS